MASRAGRACGRVAKNCRTNPVSLFSFMSRQTTLSDGTQRTLTECAETTERDRHTDDRARSCSTERKRTRRTSPLSISLICRLKRLSGRCPTRRQRSAGATKYDPATGEITISLAWDAFEQHGWEQFSSTVRHELIHAWQYHEFGEADHGRTFERWTDALDTTQYCERFKSPNWWVICEGAVENLHAIAARKSSNSPSSTAVATAAGRSASRRPPNDAEVPLSALSAGCWDDDGGGSVAGPCESVRPSSRCSGCRA